MMRATLIAFFAVLFALSFFFLPFFSSSFSPIRRVADGGEAGFFESNCTLRDIRVFRSPFTLHHYSRSAEEFWELRNHQKRVKKERVDQLLKKLRRIDARAVCFDKLGIRVSKSIEELRKLQWEQRTRQYHSVNFCIDDYHEGEEACPVGGRDPGTKPPLKVENVTYFETLDSAYLHNEARGNIAGKTAECRRHFLTAMLTVNADMGEGRYIVEWIDAHSLLGFDHFFVAAIGANASTHVRPILKDYIKWGAVTYAEFPSFGFGGQRKWYLDAYPPLREQTFWLAILELDEFLLPTISVVRTDLDGTRLRENQLREAMPSFFRRYTKKCLPLKPNLVEGMFPYRPGQWMIPYLSFGPRVGSGKPVSKDKWSVLGRFLYREPFRNEVLGSSYKGKSIVLTDAIPYPASIYSHYQRPLNAGYDFLHSQDPLWLQMFGADWWVSVHHLIMLGILAFCISVACCCACFLRRWPGDGLETLAKSMSESAVTSC